LKAKEEGDGVTTHIAKVCEVRKITPRRYGRENRGIAEGVAVSITNLLKPIDFP
jgi:hypothetical protein